MSTGAYVIAGLSYIPLIGIPFGFAAIIWGIVSRKMGHLRVALIGGGGIVCTIFLYAALFYLGFVQTGGVYDRLRGQMARPQLDTLVQAIEFYRLQYGSYPDSLQQLQGSLTQPSFISIYDPTSIHLSTKLQAFYYERSGTDHYYLRSVGADGQPFTDDDVVPDIKLVPGSKVGLLLGKPGR